LGGTDILSGPRGRRNGLDPYNNAQNSASLLGKMIRIDVNKRDPKPGHDKAPLAYGIPDDNPFVHEPYLTGTGRAKRFMRWGCAIRGVTASTGKRATYGGRRGTGSLGGGGFDRQGGNYGWNAREGAHYFKPAPEGARYIDLSSIPAPARLAGANRNFPNTRRGVRDGGYVYRGKKYPALQGFTSTGILRWEPFGACVTRTQGKRLWDVAGAAEEH